MSTRKLIKGDRYRAGLWKLEERCYEAHVRMPNAKFMIRTYRCTQGEAVAKFDSWVEAEGLDLAEDGAREACEGSIDDGMGTARRPLNREERRAMERRDRKIKKRQARKAASEADAARQSQDMGKEETEMQKVSKTDGQKTAAAGTKAPETEPARCYTLMCTGDLGTAPVMVFREVLRRQPRRGMGYRPQHRDGALRPPVRGRRLRGAGRRRVPAPYGLQAHLQREQRHQGARRSDEDAREELRRPNRRHLRPHQGEEPEEHLPPSLLHRSGKRADSHRACRMPHEDRRLAPSRFQVAQIPAIGTDGGDPF